jgi:hypothetical protein
MTSSEVRTSAREGQYVARGATRLGARTFDALLDVMWLVSYMALTGAGAGIESIRHWLAGTRSSDRRHA